MTLFDRYVVVDWSASATPKTGADSVWIADLDARSDGCRLSNPATRREAEAELDDVLTDAHRRGQRLVVGVDVALGYPTGTAARFGIGGREPWRSMWSWLEDRLDDDVHNANDRFTVAADLNARSEGEGPFWGCPPAAEVESLRRTKPLEFPLPEFRATDRRLHELGSRPFSVWQLLGVGSVGSQTLTALPVLRRLAERHRTEVWPFTTGLSAPVVEPGTAVIVEIWPSGFDLEIPVHWVKDAGQVDGVARQLRDEDRRSGFAGWWTPDVPDPTCVVSEEGWIFGVS